MNARRTRGMVAALLCSALVTTACGLKPEVKDSLAQGGGSLSGAAAGADLGADPLVEEVFEDTDGDGLDDSTGLDAASLDAAAAGGTTDPAAGGDAAVAGGSDPATGGSDPAAGGGTQPAAQQPQQQQQQQTQQAAADKPAGPNSKIGVDDKAKTLRISLHGPLTGAGVPQDSFVSGTPKYWEGRKVKGYKVIAEAFDDKYQAGPAVKACNARASKDFLIIGGAGTDQIQACARSSVLQRGNVPYLSAGVTENGLGGLGNYFATSLSYKQQGRLVVDMARKGGYLNKKWAVVISNTPNFLDAEQGFLQALQAAGQSAKVIRTPKSGADSTSVANQLREGQFESVFFLGQPLFFIELVTKVGCPAYCPQFAGPGVSMGTDSIGKPACQGSNNQYKGEFLSPGPGLDQAGKLAPGVKFKDDIEWGIYSAMQGLEQLLNAVPGESFTREGFIAAVNGKSFKGGILPPVDFTKGRFGGTGAYALKMKCGQGHVTTGFYK